MQKYLISLLIASVTSLAPAGVIASGSLSSSDGQIDGTGIWVDKNILSAKEQPKWTPAVLNWSVSQNDDKSWRYQYDFSGYRAGVSHIIFQTSSNFTCDDLMNPEGPYADYEIGLFTEKQGNPNLPDNIYGVKFDLKSSTSIAISFDSFRSPMWGDFYAKSGKINGVQVAAWNAEFGEEATPWKQGSPNEFGRILVPDTTVPEPATAVILLAGMAGIAQLARKRKIVGR